MAENKKNKVVEFFEFMWMCIVLVLVIIAYSIADICERVKYGRDYEIYREEF